MNLSARDFADLQREPNWEKSLVREMRKHSEQERLEFLSDLLYSHQGIALSLANRCLTSPASFEELLRRAMLEGNASTMRFWLECIVPRLGFRRAVRRLRTLRGENEAAVSYATYWLPLFSRLPGYSESAIDELQRLETPTNDELSQIAQPQVEPDLD